MRAFRAGCSLQMGSALCLQAFCLCRRVPGGCLAAVRPTRLSWRLLGFGGLMGHSCSAMVSYSVPMPQSWQTIRCKFRRYYTH